MQYKIHDKVYFINKGISNLSPVKLGKGHIYEICTKESGTEYTISYEEEVRYEHKISVTNKDISKDKFLIYNLVEDANKALQTYLKIIKK